MRALEPILVGLHERPGGASPHMGTFGLERMAAEMARYVAAGEMRIEHMVDLINILFAEISRLACLKRERRDMPDIDFAAITEVVASEDLEAKLSKVRLDKAAAESARHELSKRSRPGLSGAGGGDDGDGEPGDTPPLSKTAKKKAAKAAGKAKVSFADQDDAAAKATVAKEAKENQSHQGQGQAGRGRSAGRPLLGRPIDRGRRRGDDGPGWSGVGRVDNRDRERHG